MMLAKEARPNTSQFQSLSCAISPLSSYLQKSGYTECDHRNGSNFICFLMMAGIRGKRYPLKKQSRT